MIVSNFLKLGISLVRPLLLLTIQFPIKSTWSIGGGKEGLDGHSGLPCVDPQT